MQTTQKLAEYVCSTKYDDFDSEVINRAKVLCLSSLGAAVWGSRLRAGQILATYVKDTGATPEAGVIGAGFRTSAELASLANGTANHSTELEDVSHPGAIYTCQIIPAVFALGEKLQAPGKTILEGFILGHEVQSRMGMKCPHGRGWQHASHLGTIGVAAGAAKMLRLGVEETTNALSIAASLGSGLVRQTGTEAHLFEAGAAGGNGIAAAMLAKHGLNGNPNIMEGNGGIGMLWRANLSLISSSGKVKISASWPSGSKNTHVVAFCRELLIVLSHSFTTMTFPATTCRVSKFK
ncbi:MAG: MmgE/PrpD family protein [Betaproteobacteria bacterium]|nr:MmgE/PrpD family protein [Betaproteobacteria bacterium]